MKKVLPLGENVLVKVLKAEKMTEGGIVLPETASEEKPQEGEVMAVGDGKKINEKIKKGVKILFAKYSGTEIEVSKEEYLILKSEDILAVIE